jgi:hypothetical protein
MSRVSHSGAEIPKTLRRTGVIRGGYGNCGQLRVGPILQAVSLVREAQSVGAKRLPLHLHVCRRVHCTRTQAQKHCRSHGRARAIRVSQSRWNHVDRTSHAEPETAAIH